MAVRGRVHINELQRLRGWLISQRWKIEESTAQFEVLRARRGNELLLGYLRVSSNHISFADRCWPVIEAYEKARAKKKRK